MKLDKKSCLALIMIGSSLYASHSIHADLRLGYIRNYLGDVQSSEDYFKDKNYLDFLRIRLDFQGDLSENSFYTVRIEEDEYENRQFDLFEINQEAPKPGATIAQAFMTYRPVKDFKIISGLIPTLDIGFDHEYYHEIPRFKKIGSILDLNGNHLGASVYTRFKIMSVCAGGWAQNEFDALNRLYAVSEDRTPSGVVHQASPATSLDVNEVNKSINFTQSFDGGARKGYAGKITVFPIQSTLHVALGVGIANVPLNQPLVFGVIGHHYDTGVAPPIGDYRLSIYDRMTKVCLDGTLVFKNIGIMASYQAQSYSLHDQVDVISTSAVSSTMSTNAKIMGDDHQSSSWFIESVFQPLGGSYYVDYLNGYIKEIDTKFKNTATEMIFRFGIEKKTNIAALVDVIGYDDFISSYYTDSFKGANRLNHDTYESIDKKYQLLSLDNDQAFITEDQEIGYELKKYGFDIGLNMYYGEHMEAGLQYQQTINKKRIYGRDSDFVDSPRYSMLSSLVAHFNVKI